MFRIFVQSLESEDLLVTNVDPQSTVAQLRQSFDGAGGRALELDGNRLDDELTLEACGVPPDCTIFWSRPETPEESPAGTGNQHSPDSGFISTSHGSGAIKVSRDGSVTSTRRCPTAGEPAADRPAAPPTKTCSHWLESGCCPFGERCHFAFTHTEANAGREHAVMLGDHPVCKHWVSNGACPLKSCYWKVLHPCGRPKFSRAQATHTPKNSPRYAKYLKQTPMAAPDSCGPCTPTPSGEPRAQALAVQPVLAGLEAKLSAMAIKAPDEVAHTWAGETVPPMSSSSTEPRGITVMKRPPESTEHRPAAVITVMKRQQPPGGAAQVTNYSAIQSRPMAYQQQHVDQHNPTRRAHESQVGARPRGFDGQQRRTLYSSNRPVTDHRMRGGGGSIYHRPGSSVGHSYKRGKDHSVPRSQRRGKGGGRKKEEDPGAALSMARNYVRGKPNVQRETQ